MEVFQERIVSGKIIIGIKKVKPAENYGQFYFINN